jgi:hypothetical protein
MNFTTVDMILLCGIVMIGWWMIFQSPLYGLDSLSVDRARVNTDESLSVLRAVSRRQFDNETESISDKKDKAFNVAVTSADEASEAAEQIVQGQIDELDNQLRKLETLCHSVESIDSGELAELKSELVMMIEIITEVSTHILSSTLSVQDKLLEVECTLNEIGLEAESTGELAESAASVVGLA